MRYRPLSELSRRLSDAGIGGDCAGSGVLWPNARRAAAAERVDSWSELTIELVVTGKGKPYLKTSIAGLGINLDVASVLSDNCLHSIQAEARSLTNTLGGEKGVKDVGPYLRRNS